MTTQEVANRLVTLCRKGEFAEAINELYHEDVVSHEPKGSQGPERVQGLDAVRQKTLDWEKGLEQIHSASVSDPIVAGNHFVVGMYMDITMKGAGRMKMDELCVYEVNDGRIVRDQFFYATKQN